MNSTKRKIINSERNILEDMFKVVNEMKRTAKEFEDIAYTYMKKLDKEKGHFEEHEKEDRIERNQERIHHPFVQCNMCENRFESVSALEKHIKRHHVGHKTYDCESCTKRFVTKWRLKKHLRMHAQENVQICTYFKNKEFCPFDDLGCKFLHESFIQVEAQVVDISENNDKVEDISEKDEKSEDITEDDDKRDKEVFNHDSHAEESKDEVAEKYFLTSTPLKKKLLTCAECPDTTQCIDCLLKQYNEKRQQGSLTQLDMTEV